MFVLLFLSHQGLCQAKEYDSFTDLSAKVRKFVNLPCRNDKINKIKIKWL